MGLIYGAAGAEAGRPVIKKILEEAAPDGLVNQNGKGTSTRTCNGYSSAIAYVQENSGQCLCIFVDYDDFRAITLLLKMLYPRGARGSSGEVFFTYTGQLMFCLFVRLFVF